MTLLGSPCGGRELLSSLEGGSLSLLAGSGARISCTWNVTSNISLCTVFCHFLHHPSRPNPCFTKRRPKEFQLSIIQVLFTLCQFVRTQSTSVVLRASHSGSYIYIYIYIYISFSDCPRQYLSSTGIQNENGV